MKKKNRPTFNDDEIETLKLLAVALRKGYHLKIILPNGDDGLLSLVIQSDQVLDPGGNNDK